VRRALRYQQYNPMIPIHSRHSDLMVTHCSNLVMMALRDEYACIGIPASQEEVPLLAASQDCSW